jgi:hypothetical protein
VKAATGQALGYFYFEDAIAVSCLMSRPKDFGRSRKEMQASYRNDVIRLVR